MESCPSSSNSSSTSKQSSLTYYNSALHSVRRAPAKPWKKPVAPPLPTPPRVYRVDPINFRDLVQKLTAAPEFLISDSSSLVHKPEPRPVGVDASAASLSDVYKEFSDALMVEKKPQIVGGAVFLGANYTTSHKL